MYVVILYYYLPSHLRLKLMNSLQYIGPYDSGADVIFGHVYALRFRCYAGELSTVCVPFCEFWRAGDAGVSVFAVLEVSRVS